MTRASLNRFGQFDDLLGDVDALLGLPTLNGAANQSSATGLGYLFGNGDALKSAFSPGALNLGSLFNPGARAVADDYRDSIGDTTAAFGQLAPGGSVRGSIETSGDRDIFAISLTAGQRYTFNLTGGGTGGNADVVLRLLNGSGGQIAVNDDFGGTRNSQITYTATATGTFYLDARSYANGLGSYTLSSTGQATTPTTQADDYRDSLTDTTAAFGRVTVGTASTGRVEVGGDVDVFSISLTAGQTYTINLAGAASGGLSDPTLRLLNSSGQQLAANDDANGGLNSQITFNATTTGTYYLEAKGDATNLTGNYTLNATSAATPTTPPPTTPPPTTGGFDIQFTYTGDEQYRAVFDQAAARWEQVITADLPNYTSRTYGVIDDLLISASVIAIDGAGGTLGQAGPDEFRSGSLIPAHGIMQFDSADIANLARNGTLFGVILHEMGHVLGLGTLWDQKGLKSGNFNYIGANALAEYRTLSGNPNATSIPLETTGGAGTAGAHWSEAVFNTELNTGFANGSLPMSRMTIGALADLGYTVNYAAADAYTLPRQIEGQSALVVADPIFGMI